MSYSGQELDQVFKKANPYGIGFVGSCVDCSRPIARYAHVIEFHLEAWQVEHAIPRSRGGTESITNLFPACVSCNQTKGDKLASEFYPVPYLTAPDGLFPMPRTSVPSGVESVSSTPFLDFVREHFPPNLPSGTEYPTSFADFARRQFPNTPFV